MDVDEIARETGLSRGAVKNIKSQLSKKGELAEEE
jgi:predicted transcriptional regulator